MKNWLGEKKAEKFAIKQVWVTWPVEGYLTNGGRVDAHSTRAPIG